MLLGCIFVVLFIVSQIFFSLLREYGDSVYIIRVIRFIIIKIGVFVYSMIGCLFAWLLANKVCNNWYIPNVLIKINTYCFGMYLFQQFILQYLYYETSLPLVFNSYFLPWIGLLITLILSFIFTIIMSQTKIGRILIG